MTAAADGTQTVTFSATATGYTAGSDTLEVTDDEVSAVTIIDSSEGAPGFVPSSSSGWITQSDKPLAYLENTHKLKIINQVSGTQAEWVFSDLPNGQYKVATTWWHTPSRATAPYTIGWGDFGNSSGGVLATKECDQTQAPDDFTDGDGWTWEELGTVNVEHGELKVRLEDGIGPWYKNLIADAVRIEQLPPSSRAAAGQGAASRSAAHESDVAISGDPRPSEVGDRTWASRVFHSPPQGASMNPQLSVQALVLSDRTLLSRAIDRIVAKEEVQDLAPVADTPLVARRPCRHSRGFAEARRSARSSGPSQLSPLRQFGTSNQRDSGGGSALRLHWPTTRGGRPAEQSGPSARSVRRQLTQLKLEPFRGLLVHLRRGSFIGCSYLTETQSAVGRGAEGEYRSPNGPLGRCRFPGPEKQCPQSSCRFPFESL